MKRTFSRPRGFVTTIIALISFCSIAYSDVTLPPLISDHMVLQKAAKVPIWGKANPGEHVRVGLNGVIGEADAGQDGKWLVDLDLQSQTTGPFDLTVQGKNSLTVHDVLVGEVWVCGGQSNMEMQVKKTIGAEQEVAASANPQIRLFQCKASYATTPQDSVDGAWMIAGPSTTAEYTAVGYYFAKKVNKELGVPVGLLSCNVGASAIESWTSLEGLDQDPDLKATSDKLIQDATAYPDLLKNYLAQYAAWQAQNHREDKPAVDPKLFAGPDVATTDWKPVNLAQPLSAAGFPDAGAVWLRTTINVKPGQVGSYLVLHLAGIRDFDTAYWNGQRIGWTTADHSTGINDGLASSMTRRYDVPAQLLKAGPATLTVRIFAPAGDIGMTGIAPGPVAGPWLAKVEYPLPALDPAIKAAYPQHPLVLGAQRGVATMLYNGMLHPLIPYAIRGVLWYQGEANLSRAVQYRTAFPLLIKDWRAKWGHGDFPFYFCQLSNFGGKYSITADSKWAEVRDAQTAALSLPETGQAVLIDLGEVADVHFRDKKDAGDRLAFVALGKTYGKAVSFAGPYFDSMKIEGSTIRINFKCTDQGLVAKDLPATYAIKSTLPADQKLVKNSPNSQLQAFAICGSDHKWIWADAKIDGTSVVVSSSRVPDPVAVRYGWADNPNCNLYNGAGLPACPFRTDDFPLMTAKNKY